MGARLKEGMRLGLAGLLVVGCSVATIAIGGAVAEAGTTTQFTTPGCSVYTVPLGVSQLQIDAYGAQGGLYQAPYSGIGGFGGHAGGLLNVSSNEQLDVCVGGQGTQTAGGINGGGGPGSPTTAGPPAVGGGGASDVRTGSFQLSDRILVAGGGGAPQSGDDSQAVAGGGTTGNDCTAQFTNCGAAGTQTGGGAAGASPTNDICDSWSSTTPAQPGVFGIGGTGGTATGFNTCVGIGGTESAGGGGGGYYGGGGGGGDYAGGGGSGYVALSIQATGAWTNTAGVRSGDGEVDITPTISGFSVSTTSLPAAARGVAYGPVTLTVANVDPSASPYVTTLKWKKVSLPKGLKLSSAGVLSGTPSTKLPAGPNSVTVQVTETVTTLNGKMKVKTKTPVQATIPLTIT